MAYSNFYTSEYCRNHFGLHCSYFLGNYFSRFPSTIMMERKRILSTIPNNCSLLGVHARFHRSGQYYSKGINYTVSTLFPDIDKRMNDFPNIHIIIASDNNKIIDSFVRRYGSKVHFSKAIRKADQDHVGAMLDMSLLISCNNIIGTFRSSFSYIVSSRFGNRCWWIEKESPYTFPSQNSQSLGISVLYHHRDHCDWRINDRIRYCGSFHLDTLWYLYEYLLF